ncbi:TRAP transporter small permease [Brevibacillus ruminantium]|uniref:TRAP transporter small permease n=1 Tax=Brevibacillus ruminantium TaxID=2950604 RepID=A0ABY4WJQ5_9BACL|nr:TRAP transporter small permease [Brevibacillus ruminantium]USG67365.1 TRAP transporter small permease [Brevibacillus ruminantium]
MQKASKILKVLLNGTIALSLAFMAILVFGNVVLRYLFNSGITWSEEMSRFLFVWLIFLGAIGALKDNEHLSVDMLVKRLSPRMKKLVFVITNGLLLYVLWLVLDGSWKMTLINLNSSAPATGLPLGYVYGIGIVMSVCMAIVIISNLYRVLFGHRSVEEFVRGRESEEELLASSQQVVQEGGR